MRATIAAAALLLSPCGSLASENPGVTAAPVLQVPLGSRALGMGGAFTPVASDASALYYNPAGLSRLNAHEVAFTFMTGLFDNRLQHFAYGGPLPFTGFSGNGYASVGGSLLYATNGQIEVNRTKSDGSFLDSQTISAGSDMVLTGGYSERVGSTPLELRDASYGINHYLGVAGKFVRSTLVERFSARTVTGDVGYLANSPEAGLTFGASVLNVGGGLRYVDVTDPLPTTLRAGLAYQGGIPSIHAYLFSADTEYLVHEREHAVNAGFEYFWIKTYGLRLGYRFLQEEVGLTVGLGLRWRSRAMLDYAWNMGRDLHDQHRFTVSWRFGGVAPGLRARERRPMIESAPERSAPIRGLEEERPRFETPRPRPIPREERPGVPGWIY